MACYLRWVAMLGVTNNRKPGLMTDYEVMNRNFTPENLGKLLEQKPPHKPLFLAGGVPCAVAGSQTELRVLTQMLIETIFAACEGTLNMKKRDYRIKDSLCTRLQYTAAALNLCMNWTGQTSLTSPTSSSKPATPVNTNRLLRKVSGATAK